MEDWSGGEYIFDGIGCLRFELVREGSTFGVDTLL